MTISLQLYLKPIQQNSQFETSNIHWVTQILGLEKKKLAKTQFLFWEEYFKVKPTLAVIKSGHGTF